MAPSSISFHHLIGPTNRRLSHPDPGPPNIPLPEHPPPTNPDDPPKKEPPPEGGAGAAAYRTATNRSDTDTVTSSTAGQDRTTNHRRMEAALQRDDARLSCPRSLSQDTNTKGRMMTCGPQDLVRRSARAR